jgi:hypothetical protein
MALTADCTVTAAACSRTCDDDSFHDRYRRRRLFWTRNATKRTSTGRSVASHRTSLPYL